MHNQRHNDNNSYLPSVVGEIDLSKQCRPGLDAAECASHLEFLDTSTGSKRIY